MIFLGRIEGSGGADRGHDRDAQLARGLRLGRFGGAPFGGVGDEDRGPILIALVAELAVGVGRIDRPQEAGNEVGVADLPRIVDHPHRFEMTGAAAADLLVGRVGGAAATEAGRRRDHARHMLEGGFGGPEAAAGEDRARRRPGRTRGHRLGGAGRVLGDDAGERDTGRDQQDKGEKPAHGCHLRPGPAQNLSAMPFMHQRWPVGGGPSSKTWPRWPPQRRQTTSVGSPAGHYPSACVPRRRSAG